MNRPLFRLLFLALGVFLMFSPEIAEAQRVRKGKYLRQHRQLFPPYPQYSQSGWHFGLGLTYMGTLFTTDNKTLADTDTLRYQADVKAVGRPGLSLEFGRFHVLQSRLFRYLDYGLSYKMFRGREGHEGTLTRLDATGFPLDSVTTGDNTFTEHFASANFNLNNVIQVSDRRFIQNTIGFNLDYGVARSTGTGAALPGVPQQFPPSFVAQLHYKIGIGFKVSEKLMIIPSIETPILNINPFELPRSSLEYFNSRYRPLILSVRFMFFKPYKDPACLPIKHPDGYKMPTDMEETR